MQHRTSALGRPSGTDVSDFSYRMGIKEWPKGNPVSALFLVQVIIQIIGVLFQILLKSWNEELLNKIVISSLSVNLVSLIIRELGQRRSRVGMLKFCIVGSSIAAYLSIACVAKSNFSLRGIFQGIKIGSIREASKYERIETSRNLLGLLFQVLIVKTVVNLIRNMSPPKKIS